MLPPNLSRRGQGISINMVIIAAIALVVLIVAVLLVSRGGRNIGEATDARSCLTLGGTCKPQQIPANTQDGVCGPSETRIEGTCGVPTEYCCRYNFGG